MAFDYLWKNGSFRLVMITCLLSLLRHLSTVCSQCCWRVFWGEECFLGSLLYQWCYFEAMISNLTTTFFFFHQLKGISLWNPLLEMICSMNLWTSLVFWSSYQLIPFMFCIPMESLHATFQMPWYQLTKYHS